MTGRDVLNKALKRFRMAMCLAVGLFGAVFMAMAIYDRLFNGSWHRINSGGQTAGLLACFVLMAICPAIYGYLILRCPWCRANLYAIVTKNKPDRIKCCPYCSKSLDDEIPGADSKPHSKLRDDEIA